MAEAVRDKKKKKLKPAQMSDIDIGRKRAKIGKHLGLIVRKAHFHYLV